MELDSMSVVRAFVCVLVTASCSIGCSSSTSEGDDHASSRHDAGVDDSFPPSDASQRDMSPSGSPDASDTAQEWETLIEGVWTLAEGAEDPDFCVKLPIEKDAYISAIRPIHPPGTHHTFLVLSDPIESEGCTQAIASGTMLYAAGPGSEGLSMPEGVAMKLPAGKVLNLSLHILNPSEAALEGTSGIEVTTIDASDVTMEISAMNSGPIQFELPAASRTTIRHVCTLPSDFTLFALFPHMHQLGVHFSVSLISEDAESVLHDASFSFAEQYQVPVDALELEAGDRIVTECTYENTGSAPVIFGESSNDEMCISVLFLYPTSPSLCVGQATVLTQDRL